MRRRGREETREPTTGRGGEESTTGREGEPPTGGQVGRERRNNHPQERKNHPQKREESTKHRGGGKNQPQGTTTGRGERGMYACPAFADSCLGSTGWAYTLMYAQPVPPKQLSAKTGQAYKRIRRSRGHQTPNMYCGRLGCALHFLVTVLSFLSS